VSQVLQQHTCNSQAPSTLVGRAPGQREPGFSRDCPALRGAHLLTSAWLVGWRARRSRQQGYALPFVVFLFFLTALIFFN
jgi:hypothetical protein